ncbi:putative elongation factor P [Besnoitia besnoiti]|uniref:Putative elongation factor P n=1 Tax=Besnoitia besnoiti TaxID=94643 RepID=A0A2A9M623_BESBE|nr:putative elongation factor P [Besnoitia besnoiti]PFH33928.1 putative elongation factor P [Besnoitia besnoiti]
MQIRRAVPSHFFFSFFRSQPHTNQVALSSSLCVSQPTNAPVSPAHGGLVNRSAFASAHSAACRCGACALLPARAGSQRPAGVAALSTQAAFRAPLAGNASDSACRFLALHARGFATVGVCDIRQGNIVVIDGRTVEVTEWRQIKSGRGAASIGLSFIDLATFKAGEANFSVNKKLESIQPEKKTYQVMYVDEENSVVVLADENFDEAEFPLRLFGGPSVAPFLKPELKVVASLHDGLPIKVSLPPAVVQQLK